MWRIRVLLVVVMIGLAIMPVQANAAGGTVTAEAECDGTTVEVDVTNQTGELLRITYGRALLNATDALPKELTIRDRQSKSFQFEAAAAADEQGGLVVTSAGVLMPRCDDDQITLRPDDEEPALALRSISILETFAAYDALYALLHADAKDLLSEAQVTCWYADFLADTTTAEATVTAVEFGPWTWGGNGETYNRAAAVSYQQPYWTNGVRSDQAAVAHLVLDHGQWRWFLGNDPGWIAELPSSCNDTGKREAAGEEPSASTDDCAGTNPWWAGTAQRLSTMDVFINNYNGLIATSVPDPEAIRSYVATFIGMADTQRTSNPPPAARELNDLIVSIFEQYADAMDQAATAVDPMFPPPVQQAAANAADSAFLDLRVLSYSEFPAAVDTFVTQCQPTSGPEDAPEDVGP